MKTKLGFTVVVLYILHAHCVPVADVPRRSLWRRITNAVRNVPKKDAEPDTKLITKPPRQETQSEQIHPELVLPLQTQAPKSLPITIDLITPYPQTTGGSTEQALTETTAVPQIHEAVGIDSHQPRIIKPPINSFSAPSSDIGGLSNNGLTQTGSFPPSVGNPNISPRQTIGTFSLNADNHGTITGNDKRFLDHDHHHHHHVPIVLNVHIPHDHSANPWQLSNQIVIPVNFISPEITGGHFHPSDHQIESLGHHGSDMLQLGHTGGAANSVFETGMSGNMIGHQDPNQPMSSILSKEHPDLGILVENPKPIFLDAPTNPPVFSRDLTKTKTEKIESKTKTEKIESSIKTDTDLASFSKENSVVAENLKSVSLDASSNDLFKENEPISRNDSSKSQGSEAPPFNEHDNRERPVLHTAGKILDGHKKQILSEISEHQQRTRKRLTAAERMAGIRQRFDKKQQDLKKATESSPAKHVDAISSSPTHKPPTTPKDTGAKLNALYSMENIKETSELGKQKSGIHNKNSRTSTEVPETTALKTTTPKNIDKSEKKLQKNHFASNKENQLSEDTSDKIVEKNTMPPKVIESTNKPRIVIPEKANNKNKDMNKDPEHDPKLKQSQDTKRKEPKNYTKPKRRKGFLDLLFISSLAG